MLFTERCLLLSVNKGNVADCVQRKEEFRTSCLTADPLQSIIRRGGSKGGVSFVGVFNCGLEYSVITYGRFAVQLIILVCFLVYTELF
jgi:hypothetical protein